MTVLGSSCLAVKPTCSPLTFDTATVEQFLSEAQIGFAGQETAIGDAIGLAVKRLRDRPAESRVLILLTDGQDTASAVKPLEAAQLAARLGIRIYTIGVGADSMTLPGLFGSSFGQRQVNPSAELDEGDYRKLRDSPVANILGRVTPRNWSISTRPSISWNPWSRTPRCIALASLSGMCPYSQLLRSVSCWHCVSARLSSA